MAAERFTYLLLMVLVCAWTPGSWTATDASAKPRIRPGASQLRAPHFRHAGPIRLRRSPMRPYTYDGVALGVEQVPRHLRPIFARPHYSFKNRDETLSRALCRDGAPRRRCLGDRRSYDSGQLVEALLNPPGPKTRGAIRFFGLPEVEGAPPVALLAKPVPDQGASYIMFQHAAGRRGP